MDSYQLQYTQHGLVTVTLHITRFTYNRVMWKTNHFCAQLPLILRPYARNSYDCSGYLFGEAEVWRTSGETTTLLQDYHAWNSWRRKACKYTVFFFFFVSKIICLTLTVVHLYFCICDSSKNLHLLMTY